MQVSHCCHSLHHTACCWSRAQLGHNQLQQVPACVSQLTALTHLGLEDNMLQQIEPGALKGLTKLEVLQLQDNQLQQLPHDLGGFVSAVVVYTVQQLFHVAAGVHSKPSGILYQVVSCLTLCLPCMLPTIRRLQQLGGVQRITERTYCAA